MRVTREQAAAHRERIVQVASTLFRKHGFDGIRVAGALILSRAVDDSKLSDEILEAAAANIEPSPKVSRVE